MIRVINFIFIIFISVWFLCLVLFDRSGRLLGLIDDTLHYAEFPSGSRELTQSVYSNE